MLDVDIEAEAQIESAVAIGVMRGQAVGDPIGSEGVGGEAEGVVEVGGSWGAGRSGVGVGPGVGRGRWCVREGGINRIG